tara:strand:- start:1171 stop:1524 length:354 start_codon:yes stop_codon:yes gene_type:complete
MIRYEIYFAISGKHTDNAEQVHLENVLELVCDTFGGYSLQKIQGGWKHPDTGNKIHPNAWVMVEEDSYRLTLITDGVKPDKLSSLCNYIKKNFHQEEVMYTEEEVKVVKVGAEWINF